MSLLLLFVPSTPPTQTATAGVATVTVTPTDPNVNFVVQQTYFVAPRRKRGR